MDLNLTDIKFLPGVGPRRADMLRKELNIRTPRDLLYLFPYKYIDRSRFYKIREINDEETYVQIIGEIISIETVGVGKNERLVARFSDGTDEMNLVWFHGLQYLKLQKGVRYLCFGKPNYFNHHWDIMHPEMELLDKVDLSQRRGLEPHYNTSEKMKNGSLNSKAMTKIMHSVVQILREQGIQETLRDTLLEQYHLLNLKQSLINIHFPEDLRLMQRARERLKFEELFYIQLQILRQVKQREANTEGFRINKVGQAFNSFYHHFLPFPLTSAQKRVVREIHEDMKSGQQMNRLLQGDVGSGKTLVALLCALLAKDNGFQTCIMAPTEILANQHYDTLSHMLSNTADGTTQPPVARVALLTGSTTKKQRETLHLQLENGEIDILVGTHALIEDTVQFQNLGLAIIDEQHRFGVAQRARLWAKNINPPHVLVMTATPIPRTLAMTVYGDLSVSVIDELPPGRKPIQTLHYTNLRRQQINAFIRQQIQRGRQVYVVYPLIEESKNLDMQDLENGFQYMCQQFPEYKVSMVHGKMKAKDKDREMQRFAAGETQILVATTVIEVGVNVPNASVMIVENAERFGLSQLHQLRGRVGRGAEQSYCILLTKVELSKDTRRRMDIMVATNDGFRIAEADLQLRGPGDMEGTQQSGLPFELHIASLSTDGQILEQARQAAKHILDDDPNLEQPYNYIYQHQLQQLKTQAVNWGMIS